MNIERKEMDTWGSVITPHRAHELGSIIDRITAASRNPLHRQVGNVINDLRNLREFDLIDDLKRSIEAYNQDVRRANARIALRRDMNRAIKAWATDKPRREFVRREFDLVESLVQALDQEAQGLGFQPHIYQWARQELGRRFQSYR